MSPRYPESLHCAQLRASGSHEPPSLDTTVADSPLVLALDRILVDAPCSSEGRRRDPGTLCKSSSKRSQDLHRLQADLLKNAIRLTKPGGLVVYSTCTYAPEENEMVVESVLDMARLEEISIPGLVACPGITEWTGIHLNHELHKTARLPHINDARGFFVAKLVKNQETSFEPLDILRGRSMEFPVGIPCLPSLTTSFSRRRTAYASMMPSCLRLSRQALG